MTIDVEISKILEDSNYKVYGTRRIVPEWVEINAAGTGVKQ